MVAKSDNHFCLNQSKIDVMSEKIETKDTQFKELKEIMVSFIEKADRVYFTEKEFIKHEVDAKKLDDRITLLEKFKENIVIKMATINGVLVAVVYIGEKIYKINF